MGKGGKSFIYFGLAFAAVAGFSALFDDGGSQQTGGGQPVQPVANAPALSPEDGMALAAISGWGSGGAPDIGAGWFQRNLVVVLDGSGSMTERSCDSGNFPKMQVAKATLARFAEETPADVNLGLVTFSRNQVAIASPLAAGPGARAAFLNGVQALTPDGRTPLGAAIEAARDQLAARAVAQSGFGEYHIVVVTDGAASDPDALRAAIRDVAFGTPIQISTLGFCIGAGHDLNRPGVTAYRSAASADDLMAGLRQVLAEAAAYTDVQFTE